MIPVEQVQKGDKIKVRVCVCVCIYVCVCVVCVLYNIRVLHMCAYEFAYICM